MTKRSPVSRPVDVVDGQSVIEVFGDGYASMLLLAGDAVAVAGHDGSGTMGMLAARAESNAPTAAEVKALTEWLADPGLRRSHHGRRVKPPDPGRLKPLLGLLRPGRYLMSASVARRPLIVDQTAWWYDHEGLVLVPTDSWPPRDGAAVRRYRERIERGGAWPAVITLSPQPDSEVAYVLDGHHKLAAYRQAELDPLVIRLAPERPFRPRHEDVRRVHDVFVASAPYPLGDLSRQAFEAGSWADWLAEHERYAEAEEEYRTDLANLRRMIAKESRTGDPEALRVRLAEAHHRYGLLLLARGRDAEEELRSALAIRGRLLGEDHPDTQETQRILGACEIAR